MILRTGELLKKQPKIPSIVCWRYRHYALNVTTATYMFNYYRRPLPFLQEQQTSHGLRGFVVLPATPSVQARSATDEHEHAIRHRLGRIHTSCIAAVVRTSSQVFGQTHRLERSKRTLEGKAFSQRHIGCILWSCWSRDDPRYTAGQDPFKLCAWRWSVAGACRTPAPS